MTRTHWSLALGLLSLAGLVGCAGQEPEPLEPPAAPTLTFTVGLKALQFSWTAVTGADSYRVLSDAEGTSSFSTLIDSLGATTTSYTQTIAVHRVNWDRAQYALEACNAAGCTRSATVGIRGQAGLAIGYLKASDTVRRAFFGADVAVSADGSTLAVGAYGPNSVGGAVYVFVNENGAWHQQARVRGNATEIGDQFGLSIALSSDGNTLAVGAPSEDSQTTAINGNEQGNARTDSGAAYVFVRSSGTWTQQAFLKASNADGYDAFGQSVAVSADGSTVAVGAPYEDSAAVKINGNQGNNSAQDAGAAYVFVRDGAAWAQQAYFKAPNSETDDWFGYAVALAASGNTLLVGAPWEDSATRGVNGDQANNDMLKAGAAYVFARGGATWSGPTYLKASNSGYKDWFGWNVAVSGDGSTLAVGAPEEDSGSTGINGNQNNNAKTSAGAVYVFALNGSSWIQTAYVKATATDPDDEFGWSVALDQTGDTLVVGAVGDDSSALAVGGNYLDNTAGQAGAATVFKRTAGTWSQLSYLKATNTNSADRFGTSVSLSANGATLAIGAPEEDSGATGLGGNQQDNAVADAGAVYLF